MQILFGMRIFLIILLQLSQSALQLHSSNETKRLEVPTTPRLPIPGCALPSDPLQNSVYRFGTHENSRLELHKLRGTYKRGYKFVLDFKSDTPNGIIFYISDNETLRQYVIYKFSNGKSTSVIKTDGSKDYSDNQWHSIEFSRNDSGGKLVLDNQVVSGKPVSMQKIEIAPPIYIGGLHPDQHSTIQDTLNFTRPFAGCVRNINMNNNPLVVQRGDKISVVPCFDNTEFGAFFPATGGFIRLKEHSFKVGKEFTIKLHIKPRSDSGVLIAVNGRKDYLVLEMINGDISLTVENGKGPITAVYSPPDEFYLCDGRWHSVQAFKSKNVITLSVDYLDTDPSFGDPSAGSTNTNSALYLGGHWKTERAKGFVTRLPFVGCVKNIHINNEPVAISVDMAEGDVVVGKCPTN